MLLLPDPMAILIWQRRVGFSTLAERAYKVVLSSSKDFIEASLTLDEKDLCGQCCLGLTCQDAEAFCCNHCVCVGQS